VPSYQLVIFDNDGVLVDSERLANAVLADLLTKHGWPRTVDQCHDEFMGATLSRVRDAYARATFRALPQSFDAAYHERLFERFRAGLDAVVGVRAALDRLDELGIPYCVASSGTRDRVQLALSSTGLLPRFSGRIFSAEESARGKPEPDLFLQAADSFGVDPKLCAVVEDSQPGVQAGHAAGMTVCGYAAMTPAELLAGADVIFTAMTELPDLLLATPPVFSETGN
jgi:HAD superfamily hydrolase (TIGR01509 family)